MGAQDVIDASGGDPLGKVGHALCVPRAERRANAAGSQQFDAGIPTCPFALQRRLVAGSPARGCYFSSYACPRDCDERETPSARPGRSNDPCRPCAALSMCPGRGRPKYAHARD